MKHLSIVLIALYCLIGHFAFGQAEETRNIPSFSSIKILDNAEVHIRIGSPQEVKVLSKAALDKVNTTVNDGVLSISGINAEIFLTVENLESIKIGGIGKADADSVIRTKNLSISISGNGKVKMPIDVDFLDLNISGIGKVDLSGTATHVESNISGSAKVNAIDLKVKDAEAKISGVGKFYMDVTQSLELSISGSGSFYYKTKPENLNTRISGIGKYGIVNTVDNSNRDDNDSGTHTIIGNRNSDENFAIQWDNDTLFQRSERARSHWSGFEIGFNQLLVNDKFSTNIPDGYDYLELRSGKSINVNLNLFSHDFPIYKRKILFTTGLGLTLNNYRFTSDKILLTDTNRTVAAFDLDGNGDRIKYEKNKLAVNYITVPLLLQFNTRNEFKKSFHIATGLLFSYKYNSHLKLVYDDNGDRKKTKRHDEFNIQPFRYDATLRIGYQSYTLYASYSINSLFKENRGPSLHPFQIGINILNFDFF